jgi:hypothetical protein
MHLSRRIFPALGAVCVSLCLLAPTAVAAEPTTVTVRVEGFNGATLLPQTRVTTSTAPVPVEGGMCSGTSVGGALYDATHGDWQAKEAAGGVEILGIEGINLPPFGTGDYAYWAIWINNGFAQQGACAEQVSPNMDIVFAGQCFALGPDCPGSATAPDHFLTLTRPTSAGVGVGQSVSVTVGSLSTGSGAIEALPEGVTVTGGPVPVSPDKQGVATLTFAAAGSYTLQAHSADSVPSDPYTVCVHAANDGSCGTAGSSGSSSGQGGGVLGFTSSSYKGPYAVVARVAGLIEHHHYARGRAPRVLSGTVLAHTTVASVSLRLRRSHKGHCYAYNGASERFGPARCGQGGFFKVGTRSSFSYLLPEALPPGRYVLDVQADDVAGNRTTLARGTSRIVFYVG